MSEARFSRKQADALDELMESESVVEAAENAGVGRSTIYEWLKDPAFAAELEARRRAEDRSRLNALRPLILKAMVVLSQLMENADPKIRLRAASEVLRAHQNLVLADPGVPGRERPLVEGPLDLDMLGLKDLARAGVKRLLSGSLDPRTAQMLPTYLKLVEKLESPANGRGASGKRDRRARSWDDRKAPGAIFHDDMYEEDKELFLEIVSDVLELDSSFDPLLAAWQAKLRVLMEEENVSMEELDRGLKEAQRDYREGRCEEARAARERAGEGGA